MGVEVGRYLSRSFAKSSSMPVRNSRAANRFLLASAFSSSTVVVRYVW